MAIFQHFDKNKKANQQDLHVDKEYQGCGLTKIDFLFLIA